MKVKIFLASLLMISAGMVFASPNEINIAYAKAPFNLQNMVMKKNKLLEKEFAKEGIKINWHDITSGAKQTQAMAAGALDISATMNTASLLLANTAGNPVFVATGVARPTKLFAIVGKPGAEMKIEDLRGKTVVGPRGTVLHQVLIAALASKGMKASDVNFISMDIPKGMTAMMAGKVDAALLAASGIIKANEGGAKTIATAEGLVVPNLVLSVSKKFADENPDILARVVKVNRQALDWIKKNPEQAIKIGASEHGISELEAKKLADWSNYYNTVTDSDMEALQADQKFLKDNGLIENVIDVNSIVLPLARK